MGRFRDILLIESFDINNNYKKLSKDEMDKYWFKITSSDDVDMLDLHIYKQYRNMICYVTKNQGREYFIYTFYRKNIFEIHFCDMNNLKQGEQDNDINYTSNSQHVFSVVMSIVIDTIENRSTEIIKIAAPKHRTDLYFKIIQKVLKKYNINKEVHIQDNLALDGKDYLIESDWIKMTPENMWESSALEIYGPDSKDGSLTNILDKF